MTLRAPLARITVVAGIVTLQGLAMLAVAVAEALALDPERLSLGITTTAFFAAYAVTLTWCAWKLTRLSTWTRGPIVLTQLIVLGVGWSFLSGGIVTLGLALMLPACIVLLLLLAPATTNALYGENAAG